MKITDKYLALADYEGMKPDQKAKEKRIVLSDDAYAVCEFIENLTVSMNALRLKNG